MNCWDNFLKVSNFSPALILLFNDIINTDTALTTILGILTALASSLIELMIHIAEEVITKGILKQNFINDQWDEALVHRSVIASHLSNNLFLSNIIYNI
jgi:hypothetical protein